MNGGAFERADMDPSAGDSASDSARHSTPGSAPDPAAGSAEDPLDGWIDRPELRPLLRRLLAGGHPEALAAAEAEVAVARRLLERDAELRVEIETPDGRHCDFEVRAPSAPGAPGDASASVDALAYLHVKRLRPAAGGRALRISRHLARLERIERPVVVSVWWNEGAGDATMRRLVSRATRFIRDAKVGDEMRVRDDREREFGGCRILAPSERPTVTLVIGLPHGFHDRAPLIQRLLRKACQQFMPGATNVILLCGVDESDELAVETALLGSHVERWDRLPPTGTRVAHGRADDGFWHGRRFAESRIVGWCRLADDGGLGRVRLWFRDETIEREPSAAMLRRVLEE